ncbi:hypothetical protein ABT186_39740 [Streptomyces sp. NPDC001634]|uniref:hypothetical protein n=1 Tax=Streptomyces sp. NPDC001634 TaxID=3154390 RepID=UPI0033285E4C
MAGLLDSVADDSPEDGLALGLLPGGIGRLLADWSAAGPVAYVEAEYFGGVGEQHAAVWVTGPSCWVRSARPEGEPFAAAGSPISQALRRLGVVAAPSQDEFSTVGLGRHRYNERWVQADSSPRPSQSEESFTPGRAKK